MNIHGVCVCECHASGAEDHGECCQEANQRELLRVMGKAAQLEIALAAERDRAERLDQDNAALRTEVERLREALGRCKSELWNAAARLKNNDTENLVPVMRCLAAALEANNFAALSTPPAEPPEKPAEPEKLTCEGCSAVDCEYRDDPYNTNGECLASK